MRTSSGAIASNTLLSVGKSYLTGLHSQGTKKVENRGANVDVYSLEKEPSRRATPWRMLEHPWMVEMRSKRVNMQKYLSQVWGWDDAAS